MARDLLALCRRKAAGAYIVPSFGRYDIVESMGRSESPMTSYPGPLGWRAGALGRTGPGRNDSTGAPPHWRMTLERRW